MFNKLYLSLF